MTTDDKLYLTLPYRPGVGIMLVNNDSKVFVGKRIDTKADAWQMPQGGIDEGEHPDIAAMRELREEIGTNKIKIIMFTLDGDKEIEVEPDILNLQTLSTYMSGGFSCYK